LFVYNSGQLPEGWTIKSLTKNHRSEPFNPDIANAFFKAGYIESWGRGIEKVITSSQKYNGVIPVFEWSNGLNVEFKSCYPNKKEIDNNKLGVKLGDKLGDRYSNLSKNRKMIIQNMTSDPNISISMLSNKIQVSTTAIEELRKAKEQKIEDEELFVIEWEII